jgi:tight adherence protein B
VLTVVVAALGPFVSLALVRHAQRLEAVARARRLAVTPRRLPPAVRAPLASALDAAAIDATPEAALQAFGLALAIACALAVVAGPAAGLLTGTTVVIGAPSALWALRDRRARQVAAALPSVIDEVAAELRAGGTVATAVSRLARRGGPLAADFARVEARVALGARLPDAVALWGRERRALGAPVVAGALVVATTVGGRCADALDGLAASLRERAAVAAEARALSTQARISALVVGGGPIAYLSWTALVDAPAIARLVASPVGRVCLVAGLVLEAVGALWMRRILQGAEVRA